MLASSMLMNVWKRNRMLHTHSYVHVYIQSAFLSVCLSFCLST